LGSVFDSFLNVFFFQKSIAVALSTYKNQWCGPSAKPQKLGNLPKVDYPKLTAHNHKNEKVTDKRFHHERFSSLSGSNIIRSVSVSEA
jgi:hypothetical protein